MNTADKGFPWLELSIVVLTLSLIFQIWPFLFWGSLWVIDVRNWNWSAVIAVNVVVVLALFYVKSFLDP